jgi:hypothetical protein
MVRRARRLALSRGLGHADVRDAAGGRPAYRGNDDAASSGLSQTNWVGFRENLPERLDRLIGEQRMPPVVVAFSDCFTRLGDNQYINSVSIGVWKDFLLHDMRF